MISILVKVLLGIIVVILIIWLASYLGLLPAGMMQGFMSRNNDQMESQDSTGSDNQGAGTQNGTGGQSGQSGSSGSSSGGAGGQGGSAQGGGAQGGAQQPTPNGDDGKDTTIIDVDVVLPSAIPSLIPTPFPSIIPSSLPILN